MQHLGFLKVALVLGLGVAAGTSLPVSDADAAPLSPAPIVRQVPHSPNGDIHRAVTSREEAGRLAPQQVYWGHRWHHHHWHHRHWGWRHHHHWGWRHHWHRHHWRHW
ncbi:MAG: hypothetical protein WA702_07895 [Bradyrhizobium sp.]|jgi:hypothetical protein|uniref:hypothetical protein n=1 Tax=Bradyrhizobium sp. TaxID=376 RepID=UPI003C7A1C3C